MADIEMSAPTPKESNEEIQNAVDSVFPLDADHPESKSHDKLERRFSEDDGIVPERFDSEEGYAYTAPLNTEVEVEHERRMKCFGGFICLFLLVSVLFVHPPDVSSLRATSARPVLYTKVDLEITGNTSWTPFDLHLKLGCNCTGYRKFGYVKTGPIHFKLPEHNASTLAICCQHDGQHLLDNNVSFKLDGILKQPELCKDHDNKCITIKDSSASREASVLTVEAPEHSDTISLIHMFIRVHDEV